MLSYADLKTYTRNLVSQIEALPKGDQDRADLNKKLMKVVDIAEEWASQDAMIIFAAQPGRPSPRRMLTLIRASCAISDLTRRSKRTMSRSQTCPLAPRTSQRSVPQSESARLARSPDAS